MAVDGLGRLRDEGVCVEDAAQDGLVMLDRGIRGGLVLVEQPLQVFYKLLAIATIANGGQTRLTTPIHRLSLLRSLDFVVSGRCRCSRPRSHLVKRCPKPGALDNRAELCLVPIAAMPLFLMFQADTDGRNAGWKNRERACFSS